MQFIAIYTLNLTQKAKEVLLFSEEGLKTGTIRR